jgi:hypothetical protein
MKNVVLLNAIAWLFKNEKKYRETRVPPRKREKESNCDQNSFDFWQKLLHARCQTQTELVCRSDALILGNAQESYLSVRCDLNTTVRTLRKTTLPRDRHQYSFDHILPQEESPSSACPLDAFPVLQYPILR